MDLNEFTTEEIIDAINNESDTFAKQKLQAALLFKQGISVKEIASKMSKHFSRIYIWINQIKLEGLENLQIKPGRGVKSKLSKKQLIELKETISVPIKTDDGYTHGWQSKDVYQHILKKYGVKYSIIRIREILRILGFKKIVCRPRSKRRNEKLTQDFLETTKKNIICWEMNT